MLIAAAPFALTSSSSAHAVNCPVVDKDVLRINVETSQEKKEEKEEEGRKWHR